MLPQTLGYFRTVRFDSIILTLQLLTSFKLYYLVYVKMHMLKVYYTYTNKKG